MSRRRIKPPELPARSTTFDNTSPSTLGGRCTYYPERFSDALHRRPPRSGYDPPFCCLSFSNAAARVGMPEPSFSSVFLKSR